MTLYEKHTKGLVLDIRIGVSVNDILLDDDTSEAFDNIDGNIVGGEW